MVEEDRSVCFAGGGIESFHFCFSGGVRKVLFMFWHQWVQALLAQYAP